MFVLYLHAKWLTFLKTKILILLAFNIPVLYARSRHSKNIFNATPQQNCIVFIVPYILIIVLRFKPSSKPKNVLQSCDIGSQLKNRYLLFETRTESRLPQTNYSQKTIPLALQSDDPKVNKRAPFSNRNILSIAKPFQNILIEGKDQL